MPLKDPQLLSTDRLLVIVPCCTLPQTFSNPEPVCYVCFSRFLYVLSAALDTARPTLVTVGGTEPPIFDTVVCDRPRIFRVPCFWSECLVTKREGISEPRGSGEPCPGIRDALKHYCRCFRSRRRRPRVGCLFVGANESCSARSGCRAA